MRTALATVATAALLSLAACSSGPDAGGDGSSEGGATFAERPSGELEDAAADGGGVAQVADEAKADAVRSVIATGDVALRGDDVAQVLLDVRKVVDAAAGEVEQSETETDRTGAPVRSRLVLRVPWARFDEVMQGLEESADLVSSSADKKDVTTEVLDVDVRVSVQRRSIDRIAQLLDRAGSIRDVVAIEAQLSRRQADLASLEQRQTYLADQTSMSTITVSIERARAAGPVEEEDDEAGFLTGLDTGWDALTTFAVGLATLLGAILPWLVALTVLGVPGALLVRRLRRRTAPAAG
jgi:hypothetical protein